MRNTKKLDALLVSKSINRAKMFHEEYNLYIFGGMTPARLTDGERRLCNVYLFGLMWDRMTMADLENLP